MTFTVQVTFGLLHDATNFCLATLPLYQSHHLIYCLLAAGQNDWNEHGAEIPQSKLDPKTITTAPIIAVIVKFLTTMMERMP